MGEGAFEVRRLASTERGFRARFDALLARVAETDAATEDEVRRIIARVRDEGDAALLALTARFDALSAASVEVLRVPPQQLEDARAEIGVAEREALEAAAARIRRYHEHQRLSSWSIEEPDGTVLGEQVTPLDRVGLYVPGGKASYPSTVLMNAIPAKVAGVGQLVMTVPAPGGELNTLVLAAAGIAGIDEVITVGGAQAVAALAFGTESIRPVDKIVGPGNRYVAMAKRLVFGRVGIDMIAGPSEIVVVCDGATPVEWIAMDLFAQAEHDQDARALLLSPDAAFLDAVEAEMVRRLPQMSRRATIRAALEAHGALIQVRGLDEAVALVNELAPEHLELSVAHPRALLANVRHAGAIFLGRHTPEALGDYCAGPNHVLPTGRTARFSSPLGVHDFQKRSSVIACSPCGAARLARIASVLARAESLTAHARSAELRDEASA